jgi:predicted alpha/beta-fold hydrolase
MPHDGPFAGPIVEPFMPASWAPGGDLQTLIGYFLPPPRSVPNEARHTVSLPDGDALLVIENRPERPADDTPMVLLVHGLGGSFDSAYMRRYASRFVGAGWLSFRLNLRGAGEGSSLSAGLYNAGSSADLAAVADSLTRIYPDHPLVIAGFSIGGNILLKYLGEPELPKPAVLAGGIAVCPPVDLAACASNLSRGRNVLYGLKFVTILRLEARKHPRLQVDPAALSLFRPMTLVRFDDLATAPAGGFQSGTEYYDRCSAKGFLKAIETPTMLLATDDDPFIPRSSYDDLDLGAGVTMRITRGGGHMGYLSADKTPHGDHRWLDYAVVEYAAALTSSSLA